MGQAPCRMLGCVSQLHCTNIHNVRDLTYVGYVLDRSNIGIMGLNPARGMNVCLRFTVLRSTV
jgi:hypothetical protein